MVEVALLKLLVDVFVCIDNLLPFLFTAGAGGFAAGVGFVAGSWTLDESEELDNGMRCERVPTRIDTG